MGPQTPSYLIGLVLLLGCVDLAVGHAGHYHMWPGTPIGQNYIRTVYKKCSKWRLLAPAATMMQPPFRQLVSGPVELQAYLYKNCSNKAGMGMEFEITVKAAASPKSSRAPVSNYTTMLQIMSGKSCKMLKRYYAIDPKGNLTSPYNFVWVQSASTDGNGKLRGGGANGGKWRPEGADALVIFHNDAGDHGGHGAAAAAGGDLDIYDYKKMKSHAIACCQFDPNPVDSNWATALNGKGLPATDPLCAA